MSNWVEMRLSEIAEINPHEVLKKGAVAKKVPMDKLQPYCRDIPEFIIEPYSGGAKFRNGDTIMARITPCLENGKIAQVNILDENEVGFGSTEYIVFRARKGNDADFIYYLVSSSLVKEPAIKSMVGSSGRQRVQIDVIQNLLLKVPELKTQRAIASILKGLDDKIGENNKVNHNLQQQAQAIFQSWFVDFSHWGNTPPDWEQGVFSDYVTVKRGGSPRPIQDYLSAIGYRWLKISDVTSLQTPYITTIAEHIKESGIGKTVFLKSGSLVLSNSATPGIPKILDVDSCIHDGWLYFPQSEFSNEFLLLFFLQIRPKLVALGNGSVFTNLKTDILKSYPISKPPKEVLEEFDNIVKPLFSTILLNTRQNNHLICVRDSLLPKLMSGEIDVSQVEV